MSASGRARAVPALAVAGLRPERGALGLIALLVAACAFVAALLPLWLAASATAGLRAAVDDAPSAARNLEFTLESAISPGPSDPLSYVAQEGLALRDGLPPRIAAAIGSEGFVVDSVEHVALDARVPTTQLRLRIDEGAAERVTWAAGRAPTGPPQRTVLEDRLDPAGLPYEAIVREVAISTGTAATLRIAVGDRLLLRPQPDEAAAQGIGTQHLGFSVAEVVGLFDVADPADPAWFDDPALLRPAIEVVSFEVYIYHATALVAPEAYASLVEPQPGSSEVDPSFPMRYRWRLGVDGARIDATSTGALLVELARLRAAYPFLAVGTDAPSLQTNLDGVVSGYRDRRRATEAVLLVGAVGPVGAAAGALALAALLLARRRLPSTGVVRSRGASATQVLGARLLEGLLVVGPPAIAGGALGWLVANAALGPPAAEGGSLAAALVVATGVLGVGVLITAEAPAARATSRPATEGRATLRPTPRGLVRDLLVGAVGVAAAGALLGRGFRPSSQGGAPDPLLAAAPALLALAAALVAVRLLPLPVALVARALARRRDLVPVLAARGAARRPGETTIPLLVLIVATASGVFGSVVLASVQAGQEAATWLETGSDVRLEVAAGRSIPNPVLGATPPGVRARAEARIQPGTLLGGDVRPGRITVLAVDASALAGVLAGTPADGRVPGALAGTWEAGVTGTEASPIPALVAPALLNRTGVVPGALLEVQGLAGGPPVVVAGTIDALPGLPVTDRTIVVPLEAVRAADPDADIRPTHLLVAAEPGAEASLAEAYRELGVPYATILGIDARSDLTAGLRESALLGTVRTGFTASLGVALAFAAIALVAGIVLAAGARAAQLAILRTLGLARRDLAVLVLLEQLPQVAVAVAAGLGIGLALAALLVPVLGLGVFTGSAGAGIAGDLAPVEVGPVVDAAWTLLFALVPVAVVVGVVTAAAWLLARRNLARSIRMGEA